ncbi:ABC transporter permease [Mycolicibacterium tokaiense]|nr:ABC transporter permease [Mycolicibacterium tokaiense]
MTRSAMAVTEPARAAATTDPRDGPSAAPEPPASRGNRRTLAALLLAVPAAVWLLLYFVIPSVQLLLTSLTTPEPGLGNYTAIADGAAVSIIVRTLVMAVVVAIVCAVIAYPYAYLMTIATPRWRAILLILVLVPFWTSLLARTFAWVVLLQDGGLVEKAFAALGLGSVQLLGTPVGVTIAMAQVMLPFMVLPLYNTMRGINRRLVDAALSLGAHPVQAFLRVYLPLSFPGLAAGATLVLVLSLGFYVTPALVGSPQQSMLAQYIGVQVNELVNFGGAGALALTLLIVTLLLLAAVQLLTRRRSGSQRSLTTSTFGGTA